ncbi:MAG: hypothetical protein QXG01_08355 [Candidatus Bathyarchaeia archaeon]
MDRIKNQSIVLALLAISIVGILIASILLFLATPKIDESLQERSFVGLLYASNCVFGMIATFFPKTCSQAFYPEKLKPNSFEAYDDSKETCFLGIKLTHGHHPNCEEFLNHEIRVGKKSFCAGCTGLFIGASISLTMVLAYFFGQTRVHGPFNFLIELGLVGVIMGLFYPIFKVERSFLRVFLNAFFILGMGLLIIGFDSLLHDFGIDLYIMALNFFWLSTRIIISKRNHEAICLNCAKRCI